MIYKRIRDLREDNDLSQKFIADFLHVHQTTYSDYELGNLNIPTHILIQLADFYDTSIDYLLERTDYKLPYPRKMSNNMLTNNKSKKSISHK